MLLTGLTHTTLAERCSSDPTVATVIPTVQGALQCLVFGFEDPHADPRFEEAEGDHEKGNRQQDVSRVRRLPSAPLRFVSRW